MLNFKSDRFFGSHIFFLFFLNWCNQCNAFFFFTRNFCCWTPLYSERLAIRYPLYRIMPRTHTRAVHSEPKPCLPYWPGSFLIHTLNTLLLTRWAVTLTRLVSDEDIISFSMLIHHRQNTSLFFLWIVYSLCMFFLAFLVSI